MKHEEKNIIIHELRTFLNEEQRLTKWPAKYKKKLYFLYWISHLFDADKTYTETEVNEILYQTHTFNDPALLRRELFSHGFLNRTKDCSTYWAEETNDNLLECIEKYI